MVAVHVARQPHMLGDAPTALVAQVGQYQGRAKARAVGGRQPHAVPPETNNILLAVAVDVGEHSGVLRPPAMLPREFLQPRLGGEEGLVAVGRRLNRILLIGIILSRDGGDVGRGRGDQEGQHQSNCERK